MKNEKIERRYVSCELRARRADEGAQDDGRTIEGYAIRFNEDSQVLHDWGQRFIERINPSCVTDETLKECDVKMTMFHNREKLLARWNKGEGSMRLSVDDKGVKFEFEAPETELGDYALNAIRRGDISGCSFTFVPGDWTTTNRLDGDTEETVIEHTRFEWLGEMTIESDPAYLTTEVGSRSFVEQIAQQQEADKQPPADENQEACAAMERQRVLDVARAQTEILLMTNL